MLRMREAVTYLVRLMPDGTVSIGTNKNGTLGYANFVGYDLAVGWLEKELMDARNASALEEANKQVR